MATSLDRLELKDGSSFPSNPVKIHRLKLQFCHQTPFDSMANRRKSVA